VHARPRIYTISPSAKTLALPPVPTAVRIVTGLPTLTIRDSRRREPGDRAGTARRAPPGPRARRLLASTPGASRSIPTTPRPLRGAHPEPTGSGF